MTKMGISSMTGYGAARSSANGISVSVEISSVNHRQLDLRLALPDMPASAEARVAERIRKRLARGAVSFRAKVESDGTKPDREFIVDEALARSCVKRLRRIAGQLGLKDDLSLGVLAGTPGIVRPRPPVEDVENVQMLLLKCVDRALDALVSMRRREGRALKSEIAKRIRGIEKLVNRVAARAESLPADHAETLLRRIRALSVDIDLDDSRMTREIALFADKSDVTEEIARLRSHISQLAKTLSSSMPVGRPLDFLVQEMNREVNTIGSKANDKTIAQDVVLLKSELERVREQVQNVE